ncbi:hypothetical protein H4K35_07770 [Myroides sp. NP-2]|uniref:hypothetical protein n=1 Tax=Myroides sp. NP-2 TaxID=2759945 RepID=UPI0015FBB48B|nr:hypothetical protein [Myroides sp. NP-2]MBB1150030.1 hypothetical protein [Myroides sp. NP-2]
MKKLFMFLAVAGLATFGASCSSDDNKSEDPKLTLKADKTEIKVDESVTFTVESNGKAEKAAELYKDGTKITNPYKFTEEGEFSIVAKKKGAVDSNTVKIKVTKNDTPIEKRTLVLSVTNNEVNVGDNVNFTVKDDKGATVAGFQIKKEDGTVVANPWKADAAGTFKFTATKADYNDSNVVSVVVNEVEIPEVGENQIVLGGVSYDLDYSQMTIDAVEQADGSFIPKTYPLNGGGVALMFGVTIFDKDKATVGSNTMVTRFEFFIVQPTEEGAAAKTPFNTPVAEWNIYDMYSIVNQSVIYAEPAEDTQFSIGFNPETEVFVLESAGIYTVEDETAFDIKYNKLTDALYYKPVSAGNGVNIMSAKAKKSTRQVNKISTVKAQF